MTYANPSSDRSRWLRIALAAVLVAVLAVGVYLVWPSRTGHKVVAYFTSAVGLYPGDDVRIVGVPVGKIDSIEPRAGDVKITMTVHDGVKLPADAKALIISPNLVSARFIQLAPAYTGGPVMADDASIGLDRTAVPVEWDEVKEQLTALSRELGPQQGSLQGPLSNFVNQAADTFDGNGDSFRARPCGSCRRRRAGSATRVPTCSALSGICRCSSTPCRTAMSKSCSSPTTSRPSLRCWPTARRISTTRWALSTRPSAMLGDSSTTATRR